MGVKVGMTEEEAIEAMGGPGLLSPFQPPVNEDYYRVWSRWPIHVAVVHFSPDGKVIEAFND